MATPGNGGLQVLGRLAGDLVAVEAEEDHVVAAMGLEVDWERAPVARRHHLNRQHWGAAVAAGTMG